MTATNHVLTGLVIGAVVHQPALAIPLAFASHFVCDALPHYGNLKGFPLNGSGFALILGLDCSVAALILLSIVITQPAYWLLMVICGIAAASPDLMWLPGYIRLLRGKKKTIATNFIIKFHTVIQWSETPAGLITEVIWAGGMTYILTSLLS